MKKLFLSALLLWLCLAFLQAQDQPLPQKPAPKTQNNLTNPVYRIWINGSSQKGLYLWNLTDTTITLGIRENRSNIGMSTYPAEQIKWIKVRKKGRVLRGAGIGLLTGVIAGIITGLAEGDDECKPGSWCILTFTAETKALIYATLFAPTGALAGSLLGSIKTTIPINGNRSTLAQQRKILEQYRVRW